MRLPRVPIPSRCRYTPIAYLATLALLIMLGLSLTVASCESASTGASTSASKPAAAATESREARSFGRTARSRIDRRPELTDLAVPGRSGHQPSSVQSPAQRAPRDGVLDELATTRPASPLNGNASPSTGSSTADVDPTLRIADLPAFPSTVLAPGEELWIITSLEDRGGASGRSTQADGESRVPSAGTMLARRCSAAQSSQGVDAGSVEPAEQMLLPMPLEHTSVNADLDGYLASVRMEQTFANPFDIKIEAEYVFPLPQDAAVHDFVMTIGERTIRGVIRPRDEADRIYREARARGHRASLMSQTRPNIFMQEVANIEPGESIELGITYFHTLPFRDDAYEFVFPMTVGPRYNPTASDNPVVPAPRGAEDGPDNATSITYLAPDERTGHDVSINVDLDARLPLAFIDSPSHALDVERTGSTSARVTLRRRSTIPNRDFVLRVGVDRTQLASAALVTPDNTPPQSSEAIDEPMTPAGTFSIMISPPSIDDLTNQPRQAVEFIFVIDASGSMKGRHIDQAKAAVVHAARSLGPRDSVNVVRFASGADSAFPEPRTATPDNVRRIVSWVRSINASGGTEALSGIAHALDPKPDPERRRLVVFFSDGQIGNEVQVLGAIHKRLNGARIFSVGVGSSPNRYLIERMAKLGRGAVAFLGQNDSPARTIDAFFDRVSRPALSNVTLDFGPGVMASSVYPRRSLDVLPGRPLVITGRYEGDLPNEVRITGDVGGRPVTLSAPIERRVDREQGHPALPTMWARTAIADCMDAMAYVDDASLPKRVEAMALAANLVSRYTSFVAVDSLEITDGDRGVTVRQPSHIPDGTFYETQIGGR